MLRFLLIATFVLSLSACGVSPKTHLYVLDAGYELPTKPTGLRVGVWKVRLSELLDRPEIVSRKGAYEVELANFHHWAGRLGSNIDAMIVQGLSQRLDTANVVTSPWPLHKRNDYQVKIYIARFDGQPSGEATVSGVWVLLNGKGNKELARKPFLLKSPVNGNQYSDVVASLNQLTVELTGLVAEKIKRVNH